MQKTSLKPLPKIKFNLKTLYDFTLMREETLSTRQGKLNYTVKKNDLIISCKLMKIHNFSFKGCFIKNFVSGYA